MKQFVRLSRRTDAIDLLVYIVVITFFKNAKTYSNGFGNICSIYTTQYYTGGFFITTTGNNLEWTLSSMKKVQADKYFVATDEDSHPILKPIVEKAGWEIFKGPLTDVLKRFCLLIETLKVKYVLRATADNPFLFYEAAQSLCDEFVKQNKISPVDYMTYTGLPHGSGVEIFKAESLLLRTIAYGFTGWKWMPCHSIHIRLSFSVSWPFIQSL